MKLTINMDDDLLDKVVHLTGASTKTEAIHIALREVARRARLVEVLRKGTGASADELRTMFDDSLVEPKLAVAEDSAPYGPGDGKKP